MPVRVPSVSDVTACLVIPAPPGQVWKLIMDPERLEDWVTIHRRLRSADAGPPREGFAMDQEISLRGVQFRVRWELAECRPSELAIWEGRGPARSKAHTEYRLSARGEETRFDYQNSFKAPMGPLGAVASRALVGGVPQREANRSLERLRSLF